ncbi:MAG: IS30 family transposase [Oscillibacter sp.]|nr:IS30 family transposase [Oscillibacter sp.]
MTDRAGRCEIIRKIPDKRAMTIRQALRSILKAGYIIRSITTDNGSEFLEYDKLLAVTGCPVYYCHSFAAWEKGTNENHNRMIRRWFPKGTDFSKISANEIAECEDWMNNYPRKSLSWLTPREFMSLAA